MHEEASSQPFLVSYIKKKSLLVSVNSCIERFFWGFRSFKFELKMVGFLWLEESHFSKDYEESSH